MKVLESICFLFIVALMLGLGIVGVVAGIVTATWWNIVIGLIGPAFGAGHIIEFNRNIK